MSATPDNQGQAKPALCMKRTPFLADDNESDTETPSHFSAARRVTHKQIQEPDVFNESVEDIINDMRNDVYMENNADPATCRSPSVESTDLFVANTREEQNGGSPPKHNIKVKSEPDLEDDSDFMIIDPADAPSDARVKWSLPRAPSVIDLDTVVKKEPLFDVEPILPAVKSHSGIEALEIRKKELQQKVLQGALSADELDEMVHVISQLSRAQSMARTGSKPKPSPFIVSPESDLQKQTFDQGNDPKPRPKRKAPIEDASGYWARREKKEREQEAKGPGQQGSIHNTSRKSKRARVALNKGNDSDDEDLDRMIHSMLKPYDAIQHRADQGDLPAAPTITATRREDQLKQMREAASEYFDKKVLIAQKKELREATKSWGPRAVRCRNGGWEVRGLLTPMMNHQLIVGAWMMGRELRTTPNKPRGGVLADAMGLGKTIETLSCIVGNQASDTLKDAGKGATLVICPSGQMISQWMSEVKKHCNKRFARSIVHFKAGNKMDIDLLASFNIVFASYHQLRDSIPSVKEREEMHRQLKDPDEYRKWLQEQTGVLHCIEWHRVVLDEAHFIKNHLTHGEFHLIPFNTAALTV
ncbi:transcription-associated protein 1 [Colletotrichum spaethianum]|uniref:Transcription-associated protein 1 n=1 Tax=Colletotrichum spaethianum TaxID=700344 RepID=A0AA37LEQ8_9PEZI|nr:transcription-associated protein 1 [Colletotrichum spaethianum]GKT45210.1 transcription-associated protein 1 [Colletotrichum spaethianum]